MDADKYSPTRALIEVWTAFNRLPSADLERLFGFRFDPEEAPSLHPSLMPAIVARMKIQREIMTEVSARTRNSVVSACYQSLEAFKAPDQLTPLGQVQAGSTPFPTCLHDELEAFSHTGYSRGSRPSEFESDHYRALLRFHLLVRSKKSVASIGPSMECNCRKKKDPSRLYTDPDYHGLSCGNGALIKKRTHNHIVTKLAAAINHRQMGVSVPG